MAKLNRFGNITARCLGCGGALASFEWQSRGSALGVVSVFYEGRIQAGFQQRDSERQYRLYRCGGCTRGALAVLNVIGDFPCLQDGRAELMTFFPESGQSLPLPETVPEGIAIEFREGETCLQHGCFRAAAAMFRSVLDKTLRANGYKLRKGTPLEQQINLAASDGVITASRQRRAHEEIRILGNDVLHDDWRVVEEAEVEIARQYAQLLLHDFYDDRATVVSVLQQAGRVTAEAVAIDSTGDAGDSAQQ